MFKFLFHSLIILELVYKICATNSPPKLIAIVLFIHVYRAINIVCSPLTSTRAHQEPALYNNAGTYVRTPPPPHFCTPNSHAHP